MSYIKREQFIWEFTRIGKIPAIYKNIQLNTKNYVNDDNSITTNTSKIIQATLVPTFLEVEIKNEELYILKKIQHKNFAGAGIIINHPETLENFLSKNLKSQIRKNLRRTISRLEASFNISYKCYHGAITLEDFNFLLNTLKNLLTKRFNQKNMLNHFLNEWNKNTDGLFELINQKKASFIVVYDNEKPISISLNRHIQGAFLHSDCNGYDLDYSKYGLGHLDNYLLLKWCIENEYTFLDLGIGVIDYKKKWCNNYYDFEYHVYHKKNSLIAKAFAQLEINKIKAKNLIKELKIDVYIKNLRASKNNKQSDSENYSSPFSLEELDISKSMDDSKLKKLNIYLPETEGIRQPIYDYLYSNQGHVNDIEVYKVKDELNTYVFKSKKHAFRIVTTETHEA